MRIMKLRTISGKGPEGGSDETSVSRPSVGGHDFLSHSK